MKRGGEHSLKDNAACEESLEYFSCLYHGWTRLLVSDNLYLRIQLSIQSGSTCFESKNYLCQKVAKIRRDKLDLKYLKCYNTLYTLYTLLTPFANCIFLLFSSSTVPYAQSLVFLYFSFC